MFEDYYGASDTGLLPSLSTTSQRLPTQQAVTAQAVPNTSSAGTDERSVLLASLPSEYLRGVDVSALDLPTLRNLARSATALSYEQNAAKSGGLYALDNPADYYRAYGTVPISFTGNSGYYDKGVSGTSINYLTPDANATYTLYSPRTGEVIATGSGAEGLVNLAQQANALNADLGRKADWQLTKTSADGNTEVVGTNLFNSDLTTLGRIVATGLPIATAFIPGLNLVGSIAAGAGAGGISAALQDQNILRGALLGGATAGVMNAPVLSGGRTLSGAVGGVLDRVPVLGDALRAVNQLASDVTSNAATQAVGDEIVVTGTRGVAQGLASGGVNSLVNSLTPSATINPATGQMSLTRSTQSTANQAADNANLSGPDDIVVTAARNGTSGLVTGGTGALANTANTSARSTSDTTSTSGDDIVVTGARNGTSGLVTGGAAALTNTANTSSGPASGNDIVVTARRETGVPSGLVNSVISNSFPSSQTSTSATTQSTQTGSNDNGDLLSNILRYYVLASGVLDALGAGQGGSGTATTGTSGSANLGVLPTFTRGAFTPYQGNYETYGQGPEWNFFGSRTTTGA